MDTDTRRPTDPSISVSGLRRAFADTVALDGVDLTVDGPTIVGLAGPNGSGKTTLIRCLLGLLAPDGGDARVNGTDPLAFDAADRARLGYMPQGRAVYDDLTVRENVDFFARLAAVADREAAVADALAFVDLADRADDRVSDLSGGMVRRTSLASAVVGAPDVLVLDEPTVGVDPELRSRMWDAFRETRDDGTLTLVSTHYLGEATKCDRVVFLRNGRVLADDAPAGHLERTGTADLEAAFLALLDGADAPAADAVTSDDDPAVGREARP